MANNLVEYLANLKTNDPKRANWLLDCSHLSTTDFGFIRPKFVREVIAGSTIRYDFKSAYSTNPTLTPVLSSAKATVVGIFIPTSLYVPALRDGAQVKSGRTDYAFPTINFNYPQLRRLYESGTQAMKQRGAGLPYIPANSIFTELNMWAPWFQPIGFAVDDSSAPTPSAKNAIPLLGYYDFIRHYVLNSQVDSIPLRVRGYSRVNRNLPFFANSQNAPLDPDWVTQEPLDLYKQRVDFDNLFKDIRSAGSNYSLFGGLDGQTPTFDITTCLTRFISAPRPSGTANTGAFAPYKNMNYMVDLPTDDSAVVSYNDNHFGEFRQTYKADYFTAFLSNEQVQYERSTARVVADDGGVITMEQIYSMEKVQSYIRKTIFKNSDYSEFIDAHYGVTPPTYLNKPLFLGAVSTHLYFNDVVSTVQSPDSNGLVDSNTDLGSRASLGFGRMVTGSLRDDKERPFIQFTAKEPGYFMVLEWIVPDVMYYQGYDPLYDKLSLESLYYPEFDRSGYQDKQLRHIVEQSVGDFYSLPDGMLIANYNLAYAQEPAYWEYMSAYGRMSGQIVDPSAYRNWVFTRDLSLNTVSASVSNVVPPNPVNFGSDPFRNIVDIYVCPEDFNHIFANTQGLDNIQCFYRHEYKAFQPLSHRFLSF